MLARRLVTLLMLTTVGLFAVGCAPREPAHTQRRESSIPWNRPASWEGAGALGGAMPTGMGGR
jgi:hypothetical protein